MSTRKQGQTAAERRAEADAIHARREAARTRLQEAAEEFLAALDQAVDAYEV